MLTRNIEEFTAVIVDDEIEACNNLQHILHSIAGNAIQIKAKANNTIEAEAAIYEQQPDVVFLDIEMGNENIFKFLDRIHPLNFEAVFVTAYDEYAIKAFKLNAIDYIVKPIDRDDLINAIERVKERLFLKKVLKQNLDLNKDVFRNITGKKVQCQIILRDKNSIEIVDFKNLLFIEANRSYSKIVFLKNNIEQSIIMSYSIAEYEELLPPDMFYRIHKSYLINCRHISKLIKEEYPYVLMQNKLKLPLSRRRFSNFLDFLKCNDLYYA